ncbi:MAG: hypothetical protein FP814_16335 [Desulfobacterium sp.]|nr:hypothetical protein [Desulfobacterium sp.]MBU3949624.1 hypothetical protein [Pseudomonadota bacterium]MBU4009630.1 hypothetical protein [Pseudomonadota bacterium]
MRRLYCLLIISAALSIISPPNLYAQKKVLAIFNLTAANIEAMGYNGEILHALISSIETDKSIDLLPRREIEEMLFRTDINLDNSEKAVILAGKALGINFVLFGEVTKKGSMIVTRLNLMDIEGKTILNSWSVVFTDHDSILKKIPKITEEISTALSNWKRSSGSITNENRLSQSIDLDYLNVINEGDSVGLSWKINTQKSSLSYNVYRSENSDGPYQFVGSTSDCFYKDTTVKKGQSYYYNIGIIAETEPEIKSSHTTQIQNVGQRVPRPPLVMGAKGYIKRAEIKFVPSLKNEQDYFNIVKYNLYRKKNENDWENIKTVDSKNMTQTDPIITVIDESGLNDGANYTYALSSTDDSNIESPLSDPVSISTVKAPVLTLVRDDLLRKINLSWTFVENASGYSLYRKTENASWEKVADITEVLTTNFSDVKNISDGIQYIYRITAYDDKKESGCSNEVKGKTKELPGFPENLQSQDSLAKSVTLTWTAIEDPDIGGYNIYRGADCNNMQKIASIKNYRSNTYFDKGDALKPLEDGKNYIYSYLEKGDALKPLDDGKKYFYAISGFNLFDAEGKRSNCIEAETKSASVN